MYTTNVLCNILIIKTSKNSLKYVKNRRQKMGMYVVDWSPMTGTYCVNENV